MLGLYLRSVVPESHLKDDTLSLVKLATGLIATMSALVLGLLISSAKGSFDRINNNLVENAARVMTIDHLLRDYGPETGKLREMLKAVKQPIEIEMMRRIKAAFDPNGIMNPGKVL